MNPPCLVLTAVCCGLPLTPLLAHPEHAADGDASHIEQAVNKAEENKVTIRVEGAKRIIDSNGIPDHETGRFPHRGNPSRITEQTQHFEMPVEPVPAAHPIPAGHMRIGVALNGVVFDPLTAEYWQRNPRWNYEAIVQGKRLLGLDQNNAHVQPDGTYHYHGIPVDLVKKLKGSAAMVQVGWAADGFPIYGPMAHKDAKNPASPVVEMKPSYALVKGRRPRPPEGPGGNYDGTFGADFEYVPELGDLDACNGRFGVTPEFPAGTYYYVLTEEFPYTPRIFRGVPDATFAHGPGGMPPGGGGPGGGPPHHHPPGRM